MVRAGVSELWPCESIRKEPVCTRRPSEGMLGCLYEGVKVCGHVASMCGAEDLCAVMGCTSGQLIQCGGCIIWKQQLLLSEGSDISL